MISYVKGILAEKAKNRIVGRVRMMGIDFCPDVGAGSFTAARGRGKIYTHLQVREDDMSL